MSEQEVAQVPRARVEIYTWQSCSYCLAAKRLLRQKGVEFVEYAIDRDEAARAKMAARAHERRTVPLVTDYPKNPPYAAALKKLLKALRLKPRELLRTKEEEYTALGLDDPALSDEALVAAMIAHPILIERPIVVTGAKAALGRPPEKALELV